MESSWSLSWSFAVAEFLEAAVWGSLAPVDRFGIARGVHVASPVMPKNSLALFLLGMSACSPPRWEDEDDEEGDEKAGKYE